MRKLVSLTCFIQRRKTGTVSKNVKKMVKGYQNLFVIKGKSIFISILKDYAMRTNEKAEIKLYAFLTSALDADERVF